MTLKHLLHTYICFRVTPVINVSLRYTIIVRDNDRNHIKK
jgi:hypothetical protein